ncbi:MAG: type II toxin-antitoxin system RelB/DinJ family antitoxin [Candidatus Ornithomonoglobus sp.]
MAVSSINVQVDQDIMSQAQNLFSGLGMDLGTAINVFLRSSIEYGGIPFVIRHRSYNPETEAAMQEALDIVAGKVESKAYSSAGELFEELDNEC